MTAPGSSVMRKMSAVALSWRSGRSLVDGVVGEREHHPELAAFAGADFDAADDAVGAGCGGNLDAVGVAALVIEHRGEVDRGRVAADADGVDGARRRRGGNNHEAQREGREAPDQAQVSSPRSTLSESARPIPTAASAFGVV